MYSVQFVVNSFKIITDHFLTLFKEIPHFEIISQRYGINNHPIWLIGHLALSYDLLNEVLTGKAVMPKEWHNKFAMGSLPMPIKTLYPKNDVLIYHFLDNRNNLIDNVERLTLADLCRPCTISRYAADLPTMGDMLVHIMIAHTQYHTGQLATYRMVHQLDRVPERFDTKKINTNNPEAEVECPFCDKKFTKKFGLSNHIKSSHPNEEPSDSKTDSTQGTEPDESPE